MKSLLALGTTPWATLAAGQEIAPRVVSAPTLDEIGLIALAIMVGVVGGVIARRKK
jgi:ABC-type methionine transport system permease subunit